MRTAFLVTPMSKDIPVLDDVDYIGVDAGALKIIEKKLPITLAVGDFDSISESELKFIQSKCEVIKHPVRKNETDSELAIRVCKEKGYDIIYLHGALSGRLDHTLLNIRLLMYKYNNLICIDENQKVRVFGSGKYEMRQEYSHVSFFAIEDTIITLSGFEYPLDKRFITVNDMYTTSNAISSNDAYVQIDQGKVICIESNIK